METYYMITARGFIDAQNGADIRERIISILVEHPRDILINSSMLITWTAVVSAVWLRH